MLKQTANIGYVSRFLD